jgi:hypothetical protein
LLVIFFIVLLQYYTSPVSEYTFSTDMEALNYLFSEMDEHVLEPHAYTENTEFHVSEFFLCHVLITFEM